jgi:hypothetical protein
MTNLGCAIYPEHRRVEARNENGTLVATMEELQGEPHLVLHSPPDWPNPWNYISVSDIEIILDNWNQMLTMVK